MKGWAVPERFPSTSGLIAATNRNLTQMMGDKLFRSDLYYRLKVFPITTPPLRDHPEDIPALARHFTKKYAAKMNRQIEKIPSDTMTALINFRWPGNVRELENFIERAVILSRGPNLRAPLAEIREETVAQMGECHAGASGTGTHHSGAQGEWRRCHHCRCPSRIAADHAERHDAEAWHLSQGSLSLPGRGPTSTLAGYLATIRSASAERMVTSTDRILPRICLAFSTSIEPSCTISKYLSVLSASPYLKTLSFGMPKFKSPHRWRSSP